LRGVGFGFGKLFDSDLREDNPILWVLCVSSICDALP